MKSSTNFMSTYGDKIQININIIDNNYEQFVLGMLIQIITIHDTNSSLTEDKRRVSN